MLMVDTEKIQKLLDKVVMESGKKGLTIEYFVIISSQARQ